MKYADSQRETIIGDSGVPRNFFRCRGVQHIQLRTEDIQNINLGAVAHLSGVLEAAGIWYKKFHFIL